MRLIAFDLDGTLLDHDKTIPARSVQVVKQLRAHGCVFAVITGRARVPQDVLEFIEPDATAVNNGGTVMVGEQVIAEHHLSPQLVQGVIDFAPEGAEVAAFARDVVFITDPEKPEHQAWTWTRTAPLHEALQHPILKVNVHHPDAWRVREQAAALGDVHVTGGLDPYPQFLTVTPEVANKGQALRDIARALNVPLQRTIAFGDSDNDLAMFGAAGTAIQVGAAECLVGAAHHRVSCSALGLPGWLEDLTGELARELSGV